jgi:hypothetical protein
MTQWSYEVLPAADSRLRWDIYILFSSLLLFSVCRSSLLLFQILVFTVNMRFSLASVVAFAAAVHAGTILWDGRFNTLQSAADLNTWSWSNQVGPYQYYIHGSSSVTSYINLSPTYKNPADTGSKQGVKFTLDSTAYWNGQTMRRTELIPQTTAAINAGKVWYHFSIKRSATNAPSIYREHQICFFESHFTELKAGWISGESGTSDTALRWDVGGTSKWSTVWEADVWHNVAYEIVRSLISTQSKISKF